VIESEMMIIIAAIAITITLTLSFMCSSPSSLCLRYYGITLICPLHVGVRLARSGVLACLRWPDQRAFDALTGGWRAFGASTASPL